MTSTKVIDVMTPIYLPLFLYKLQLILRQIRTCKTELEFFMLAFPGNQVFTAK